MAEYRIRGATPADADALVHHRVGMFSDMGVEMDAAAVAAAFRRWLDAALPAGVYRAWIAETAAGLAIGGGGIIVRPWPPGPRDLGDQLAFVYNVYVEPPHRGRGVARMIMHAIHAWCREAGIASVGLNASDAGRQLYESLGYRVSPYPMMVLGLGKAR